MGKVPDEQNYKKAAKNPMAITDTPVKPWEKVCLDIVGPLPEISGRSTYLLFRILLVNSWEPFP